MPSRLCLHPGCPDPATYRGRCTAHAAKRDRTINRAGRKLYVTKRWRMTRRSYLSEHPICEKCESSLAEVVHHRIDLADGGDPHAFANLEALCSQCHNRETRQRQLNAVR